MNAVTRIVGAPHGDYIVLSHKDGEMHVRNFPGLPIYRPREIERLAELKDDPAALGIIQMVKRELGGIITSIGERSAALIEVGSCGHVDDEDLQRWRVEQWAMCPRCWFEGKKAA